MDFPPLVNDRIIRAALGEPVDKIPIWIMRQAGRFLPEFRELRSKYDFFTLCQTPRLATEVTLLPILRYDLDAAIIFSDILVIPQAMGMVVEMKPGVGPVLPDPLKTPACIKSLHYPIDVNKSLGYVFEALTLTRIRLNGKVPLIGFSGAPWTLMCYMIEGGGSKTMSNAKSWLYKYPIESKELLDMLSETIIDYLVGQIEAGAQLIQLFESNAEYLNRNLFQQFSYAYIVKIYNGVKSKLEKKHVADVPMIIFAKGAHYALDLLAETDYNVIGVDWTITPSEARKQTGSNKTLQGNLDPCALYGSKEQITTLATEMVSGFGKEKYIANLGHGIYPDVNPDSVETLIKVIHDI